MKTHPHAEATYEVIALSSGGFGVKVSIPETNPTTVSSFDSEVAAETWIALHKSRAQAQPEKAFRRSKPAAAR